MIVDRCVSEFQKYKVYFPIVILGFLDKAFDSLHSFLSSAIRLWVVWAASTMLKSIAVGEVFEGVALENCGPLSVTNIQLYLGHHNARTGTCIV